MIPITNSRHLHRDRSCLPIMVVADVEDVGYVAKIAAALSP